MVADRDIICRGLESNNFDAGRATAATRTQSHISSSIGYLLARQALSMRREYLRPPNGSIFLGWNDIVIKSHGGSAQRDSHNPQPKLMSG
jgi:hypothetical protein